MSGAEIKFLWYDKHIYILTSFYYSLKIHTQTHFKKKLPVTDLLLKNYQLQNYLFRYMSL